MEEFTKQLYEDIDNQLSFINLETDDCIKRSELSVKLLLIGLSKLKKHISNHKFKSQAEEIKIFKSIKPQFFSKLIYHISVYNIETRKPHGGAKVLKKYLQIELSNLKRYFESNLDFYKYHRTDSNYLDHKYFIRGNHDIRLSLDTFFFETDPRFSTSHDFKVSKILANVYYRFISKMN